MGNLSISELDQSDLDQIQSDLASQPEAEYQDAVFTLQHNRNNLDGRHQISVVPLDSESYDGEDDQHRTDRLHCNTLRAERRANDEAILRAEDDLDAHEHHNPRVAPPRGSPPRPRNIENEFVLDYDGHEVFATPSANMAAVFQVFENLPQTPEIKKACARLNIAAAQTQGLRKEYSN